MRLKQNKGITLVAIVVTIVVMLILAGVAIKVTIGNGGIIGKTQEAKQGVEDASLYQKIMETIVTSKNKNGKINQNTLLNKLQTIDTNSTLTYDNTVNSYEATVGGQNYTIGEYGEITTK